MLIRLPSSIYTTKKIMHYKYRILRLVIMCVFCTFAILSQFSCTFTWKKICKCRTFTCHLPKMWFYYIALIYCINVW